MSSSQRAERRRFRTRRPWSLRRRLIVQLAALLALVCVVVGAVTEFALSEFLVRQQDDRLKAATDRATHGGVRSPWEYPDAPPPDPQRVLGQGAGPLAVVQNQSLIHLSAPTRQ